MFLVLPKIKADPIPNAAVRSRYKIPEARFNFQTKNAIGMCTTVQIIELATFADHSSFKVNQSLPKIYPLKAVSSEKAVAKERPSEESIGILPIFAPKLKCPYLKKLVNTASITKIAPSPNER